jgi:hypothetical protein
MIPSTRHAPVGSADVGGALQPAAEAHKATNGENPERIDAGGKADQRGRACNYGSLDIVIRAARQNKSAGGNQAERYWNKP